LRGASSLKSCSVLAMGMDELNVKLRYVFGDVVVRKDVVLYQEVARLPRFISEYLISSLGRRSLIGRTWRR